MPQTVKNINPSPIKTQGIPLEVVAPKISPATSSSGVGEAFEKIPLLSVPIPRLELGSFVGVGSSLLELELLALTAWIGDF